MRNDLKIDVCFGCYASYNDGFLFDKGYKVEDESDLDLAIEDFKKHVVKSVLTQRPDWAKDYVTENYAEEIYIADLEVYSNGEFIELSVDESVADLRDFLQVNEDHIFNHPIGLVVKVAEYKGTSLIETDENIFCREIDNDSDESVGRAVAELDLEGFFEEGEKGAIEFLTRYFDYEKYGRDLRAQFTTFKVDKKYYVVAD